MTKKINLIIALFALTLISNAQILNVKWGAETEIPNKNDVYEVFPGADNSIYIIRIKDYVNISSKYYLEKYNTPNYNLVFDAEIEFPKYNKKEVKYKDLMVVGKKLYAFSTYYSEGENKNYCFVSEVNQTTGALGALLKINEIVSVKKGEPVSFTLRKSIDDSRLLVFHHDPFEESNGKFNFQVLDENINVFYTATVTLPYPGKKIEISNYTLDKDGNIFLLVSIERENQDKESEKPWYRFSVLSYMYKSKELKEYNVDPGDKYVTNITFRHNDVNKSLVVVGFYSEKGSGGLKGEFLVEIDKESKKVIRTGSKEFSADFLAKFMSEKQAKQGKEPQSISINDVLFTKDGGIIIAGEQSYITTRCSTDSKTNRTTCVDTYHNKSILVSKVNKAGTFEWSSVVPKLQVSGRSLYGSYYLTNVKDKVFVIYNDNPDNITNQGNEELANFKIGKNGVVVLATIDSKGNVNRQVTMVENEKSKTVLAPKTSIRIADNEALLFASWGKELRFGKMLIE